MSDHVKTLEKAREEMVKARRGFAAELAKPFDRQTADRIRSGFLGAQAVIEQIDKAIDDERKLAPAPPMKGFSANDPYGEADT